MEWQPDNPRRFSHASYPSEDSLPSSFQHQTNTKKVTIVPGFEIQDVEDMSCRNGLGHFGNSVCLNSNPDLPIRNKTRIRLPNLNIKQRDRSDSLTERQASVSSASTEASVHRDRRGEILSPWEPRYESSRRTRNKHLTFLEGKGADCRRNKYRSDAIHVDCYRPGAFTLAERGFKQVPPVGPRVSPIYPDTYLGPGPVHEVTEFLNNAGMDEENRRRGQNGRRRDGGGGGGGRKRMRGLLSLFALWEVLM
jgi:hypothetical protein